MKKKTLLSLSLILSALAIGTITFSKPNNKFQVEGMLDENHYREAIYDEPGVKPAKLQIMDFSDYTQQPSGDNYYNTQKNYHMNSLNIGTTWNNYRGDGVTVAVIDTGINYSHEDFVYYGSSGTSISNKSACFSDPNGTGTATKTTVAENGWSVMTDENGHGTNVASTIASRINGKGCVGVAPNVDLIFCKTPNLMSSEVSAAIRYAADNGANIITMSLGMYATSFTSPYSGTAVAYSSSAPSLFSSAINYAHNKGCIILASAGNDNTSSPSYPACNNYVIGVGALASNSRTSKAEYSNFNLTSNTSSSNNNVDVTVVGSVYVAGKDSNTQYKSTQGTSFSCPITAAALALYCQANPSWTVDTATKALYDTCTDIGTTGWDTTYGYGCVDISGLVGVSYDLLGISLDKSTASIYSNNGTTTLTATTNPTYATANTINWSTSNSSVASISTNTTTSGSSITVTGKSAGSAIITATSSADSSKTATCQITVNQYTDSSFTVDSEVNMITGDEKQINVSWVNTNPTNTSLLYESSDTSVCTVSDGGKLKAIKAGTATITIVSADDMQEMVVTVSDEAPGNYVLVTNASTLAAGDKILFVSESGSKVNGSLNSTYLNAVDATISNHTLSSLPSNAAPITLGGSSGSWTFTINGSTTLYANGSGFSTTSQSGYYSTYSISISSNNAVVKANNSYQIYYNSGSPRFKPYSNAQQSFQLYKKSSENVNPSNYTVSFDSNGGTGTMSDQTTNGSSYVVPSCTFTRTNYTFNKWALNSASGTQYSVGDTISSIGANITLYATWTSNQSGGDSTYSGNYYQNADTSSAVKLSSSLHTIISTSTTDVGYDGLWSAYETTDLKANGKIWDMYSNIEFDPSDHVGNYSKEGDVYNREHTIPQSWFKESSPMKADLFHVYPTDGYVNNRRSNYPHGDVGSATYTSGNGSKLGTASFSGISGTVFEPIDEYKGDFARSYFYFATRYSDKISSFTSDGLALFQTSFPYLQSKWVAQYLSWHLADPVSQKEIDRNNAVQSIQHNRNPYIDHPEWVNYIFNNGSLSDSVAVTGVSVSPSTTEIALNGTSTLNATVSPTNASNKNVTWFTSNSSVVTVSSSGVITGVAIGSATITATTEDGGFKASCVVTVSASPTISYQLECSQNSFAFNSGTNHSQTVSLTLYQYSNGVKGGSVATGSADINTTVLGNQVVSLTHNSVVYSCNVKVTNDGSSSYIDTSLSGSSDTISASSLAATNTTYTNFSNVLGSSNAKYAGNSAKDSNGNIQLRSKNSNSGIVQTTSGGKVASVKINVASGSNKISLYGKNTAYSSASDLYDNNQGTLLGSVTSTGTITITGDYNFIGIRSDSGAVYISSIVVNYKGGGDVSADCLNQAKAWATYFINETRTSDVCLANNDSEKLSGLKAKWSDFANEYRWMVADSKDVFCSSDDAVISAARIHYLYIVSKFGASSLGNDGAFVKDGSNNALSSKDVDSLNFVRTESSTVIISVIALASLTSIGAYLFIKKKK